MKIAIIFYSIGLTVDGGGRVEGSAAWEPGEAQPSAPGPISELSFKDSLVGQKRFASNALLRCKANNQSGSAENRNRVIGPQTAHQRTCISKLEVTPLKKAGQ